MLFGFFQWRQGVGFDDRAVDAKAHEALRLHVVEEFGEFAFALADHRRQHHHAGVRGQAQCRIDHLRHALRLQRQFVNRTVRRADARVQQPQIVVDFGDGADGRARIVRRRALLDRNRRRKPFDQIDVGLFHQLQKLARVSRQRFDVAALAFRVQRVERERRLARARQSRDHDQPVPRQIEIDVFQIVRACAPHSDFTCTDLAAVADCAHRLLIAAKWCESCESEGQLVTITTNSLAASHVADLAP